MRFRDVTDVAQVVVRLADSVIAVEHVPPGRTFRIGRGRADLALDFDSFFILESIPHFVIRRAAGAPVEPLDTPVDLVFGNVSITISLATLSRTPLPRRDVERRPLIFGASSLFVHAGLLLLATWLAQPDDETVPASETSKRRPTRIARFAVPAQTVKREKKPVPDVLPITTDDTPAPTPATDTPNPASAQSIASMQSPNGLGPIKVARTAESHESVGEAASNERRFDPTNNPAFDTVKVGNYSTVATGAAAGKDYELAGANGQRKPLIVVSCDASSCVVIGGDAASGVRDELQRRLPEIVACYEAHASTAGSKVELDFGIDATGKVDAVKVGGVGDYDSCVAKIINSLEFGK